MIVITNRNLQPDERPENRFGKYFNAKGPADLTLVEVHRNGEEWNVNVLPQELELNGKMVLASEKVFVDLQTRMREQKKNCIFFIHGFNNSFKEVIERGWRLQENFGVEVAIFSWPADGGGVKGVLNYKTDKREAQLSVVALDRTLERINQYIIKYKDSGCYQCFNLLMHSMGNYLFYNLLKSSVYTGETLIFDNIAMVAADVNNKDHHEWVDRVQFRKRLYITINEDDGALLVSRLKVGDKQLARLGHYTRGLTSLNAVYLDFTNAAYVGRSHAYFEEALENEGIRQIWASILNGQRAETGLRYNAQDLCYEVQ